MATLNEAERALHTFAPDSFDKPADRQAPTAAPSARGHTAGHAVDRARAYLQAMDPAIEGQGGDQQTFRAACVLVKDFDLDDGNALALLGEYNARCVPPWSERELEAKIQHARRYGTHQNGAKLVESPQELLRGRRRHLKVRLDAGDLDLPRIAVAALTALQDANEPPELFRYGGLAVRVERDELQAPIVRPLTEDRLRYHLARAADWFQKKGDGRRPALPPIHVVRDLLAHPALPLPVLVRIVETPVFDADGRVHNVPGFARSSGLFYAPDPALEVPAVPARPTPADINAARELLLSDLLGDFPFVGDPERAHALGLLLQPFLRDLIHGATPLYLIEKPAPGTGASLLVEAVLWPTVGRAAPVMVYAENEVETQKRIVAKLVTSPAAIVIDNLRRRLDSASISAAITATVYEDRVLGTSTTVRIPVTCAWVATANNPALSNEIARRSIRIRLDARTDRPWLRTGFRHPDLRAWLREERPRLVWAALTLGQAWIAEGRPNGKGSMGHFERWAEVIGGVLNVAGIPGFLGNLEEFYSAADEEARTWRAFVAAWWDEFEDREVGVAALWKLISPPESDPRDPIALDLGDKGEKSQRTRLGKLLYRMRDRTFEGKRIEAGRKADNAQLWRLVHVG